MRHKIIIISVIGLSIGMWFMSLFVFGNPYGFFSIENIHSKKSIVQQKTTKLLKEETVKIEIKAVESNLGIMSMRFGEYVKTGVEDTIQFRIKEKDANVWYHTSTIQSGAIEYQSLYPFGFPLIADSKGKSYVIEITSLAGDEKNAITIDVNNPRVSTVYILSRQMVMKDFSTLRSFVMLKFITVFHNFNRVALSLIWLLPLLLFWTRKKTSAAQIIMPLMTLIAIAADILFIRGNSSSILLCLGCLWVISSFRYSINSAANYIIVMLILIAWIPFLFIFPRSMQEKLNVWVYFFLLFGAIKSVIEELFEKVHSMNYGEQEFDYENDLYVQKLQQLPKAYYLKYLNAINEYANKRQKLLIVGCGIGYELGALQKDGFVYGMGVDISHRFVKEAEKQGVKNVRWYNGFSLSFKKKMFDLVSSFNVLEHTKEPELFIKEQIRVLKPKGYIIIVSPNFLSPVILSPHPRLTGVNRIVNIYRLIKKLTSKQKTEFERIKPIIREDFQYDDDAIVIANHIDIISMLVSLNCTVKYSSGFVQNNSLLSRIIDNIPILRVMMPSCFIIGQKNT